MEIPTNGSQRRLNILGALDLEDMAIHTQEYETINADAIIAFLSYLLSVLPGLVLHIILDQARYHTCAAVEEWAAKNPRIKLHFLPAYSPNLNTIERVWKIMHGHTVNNAYSPAFKTFTEKIRCLPRRNRSKPGRYSVVTALGNRRAGPVKDADEKIRAGSAELYSQL